MPPQKILGWILLSIGILIIIYSLLSSFNIFTGKASAPQVFKIEAQEMDSVQPEVEKELGEDLEDMTEEMAREELQKQLQKMIPQNFLPELFNRISWSIFALVLIFAGAQVSGLGIRLIKK